MTNCTLCDERGMIQDRSVLPNWSARSCKCGKYGRLVEEQFKGVTLEQLLSYGMARRVQKEQQMKTYD